MHKYPQSRRPSYAPTTPTRKVARRRRGSAPGAVWAQKGKPPSILIIAIVIVALFFCWIFGRGCSGDDSATARELSEYLNTANSLIARSNSVGTEFNKLRSEVSNLSRDDIARQFSRLVANSKEIVTDTADLDLPGDIEEMHGILELALTLRSEGVEGFQNTLLGLLDSGDAEGAVVSISDSLMDFVVSDAVLERFSKQLHERLVKAKVGVDEVTSSIFLVDPADALQDSVRHYISGLTGEEVGSVLHGVAVLEVVITPEPEEQGSNGNGILPHSKSFSVKVTVENQGNQEEKNIPVVVTLTADNGVDAQKKKNSFPSLKAGESASLIFEGLSPEIGLSVINTLHVKAGPVTGEKNLENNEKTIKFSMRKNED